MSRPIKYRAWHKKKQQMCEILRMDFWDPTKTGKNIELCACQLVYNGKTSIVIIEDLELMEYTGLQDKNGKKIFEADIVRVEDVENRTVVYELASFNLVHPSESRIFLEARGPELLEVIGNVYEHPSLLNATEKLNSVS